LEPASGQRDVLTRTSGLLLLVVVVVVVVVRN
jgi:hypothetical protein